MDEADILEDRREKDESRLVDIERDVLDAYKQRSQKSVGTGGLFKIHPLAALEGFLVGISPEQLVERCRMCAEKQLHLPVMAWISDKNARVHLFALHIIAKLTNYVTVEPPDNQFSLNVCKELFSLGALPLILMHCQIQSSQAVVTKHAATILTNMAEYSQAASRLITKSDALQQSVDIVKLAGEDEDLPIACANLLCVLSRDEENRVDMSYTNDFLPSLEACLQVPIQAVQHSVFTILANLALDSYMKTRMADIGGGTRLSVLQKVISKLSDPWPEATLVEVARVIANITVDVTTHTDLKLMKVQQGSGSIDESWQAFGTGAVGLLMNTQSSDVQLQLTRIFRNLAFTPTTRRRIVNCEAPAALFQLITDSDIKNKEVHYWAAAAIAKIAESQDMQPRLIQEKGLRPLVSFASLQVTKSGPGEESQMDVRTRHYAALTLSELAMYDENADSIISEGGLVPLLVWARGFGNNEIQQTALQALNVLGVNMADMDSDAYVPDAPDDDGPDAPQQTEVGVKELVTLANSPMGSVQEYAATELARKALNREAIGDVIKQRALPPLIKLAKSANEKVQIAAQMALLNLSSNDDGMDLEALTAKRAKRQEVLKELLAKTGRQARGMDPELADIESEMNHKLGKINSYVGCMQEVLLGQLTSASDKVKHLVVQTIANLTVNDTIRKFLLKLEQDGEGGIFTLIQVLSASQSTMLKVQAARALLNLAYNDDCVNEVYGLRGVNVCLSTFKNRNPQLKRLSIGIMAQLASKPDMREKLKGSEFGLVAALIEQAYQATPLPAIVQEQIARCLAMLGLDDFFRHEILKAHGTELLIRWAGSNRTTVQVQAAMALCNMLEDRHGRNASLRTKIYEQGALQIFFTLSQVGHPPARLQVIRVMRHMRESKLTEDLNMTLAFMIQGGITPLLHMVREPPEGEWYMEVRGDAAQELCNWMLLTLEHAPVTEQRDLRDIIMPVVAILLIERDSDGIEMSTPQLRTEVLKVCDLLLHVKDHKQYAVDMLASETIKVELYGLWLDVMKQIHMEKQAARRAKKGKPPLEKLPGEAEVIPHSEEFRQAVKNCIEMLRLEGKLDKLDELHIDIDDTSLKAEKPMDLEFKDTLAREGVAAEEANEDMNAVSAGLDKMQDQLMQLQVSKLDEEALTNTRKVFKIVVVGDAGVGKSSIIYRYCNQQAPPMQMTQTMGCEYRAKRVERLWSGVTVLLQIFDIQGHDRYRKAAPRSFFKDAHGAVVVFDSKKDSATSFYNATDWKKTVDSFFSDFGRPNAPCVLLANKSDVANDKKFANVRSSSKMADVVRDHGYVSWHAVSAQEGDGLHDSVTVSNAFDSLIDQMLEWDAAGKYEGEDDGTVKLEDEEVSQGGGCC